jgi:TrbL/VirB6 plasmid conjugal transfer protein
MDWTQYLRGLFEAVGRIEGILWPLAHPEQIVAMLLDDSLGLLLKVWFGFILHTTDFETGRDFTSNITIHRFAPPVQLVADAALVLVLIWACYRIMWGHGVRAQYTVRALLPRLLMGTILINFSLPLFQAVVQASNAMCDAIQSFGTIPDWKTWWSNYSLDQTHGVWQVITTGVLVAGYDVLAVTYLIRYAILIALAITAPIAALLFTLPDTHHFAKLWSSLFITNLLMQPAQLFVLAIGFALENGGHSPVHHLFALAALLIVFKVPGALGGAETTAHKLESAVTAGLRGLERLAAHAA